MMFFNFSQFFANQGPNAFYEEFLKTEGLTLEQILDHDDTVTEVKKSNAGLLAKLQPLVPRLIEYISVEPQPDASEKEGHRYPFISCEILNSESFLSEFARDPALLPVLFHYLESDTRLNLTLVGYCASVSQRVLERQSIRVLDFLFQEGADYTGALLRHIGNRAIAELVVNVLVVNAQFAARQKLLQGVVMKLGKDVDRETIVNVGFTVSEVIRRSADVGEWRNLIATLLSTEAMEKFAEVIAVSDVGDVAAGILTAFMSHSSFDDVTGYVTSVAGEDFSLASSIKPSLVASLEYLSEPLPTDGSPTSYGSSPPLGQLRLALVSFVNTSLRVLGSDFDYLLCDKDYYGTVTKLFLAYPWHSGLHLAYEALVRTTIEESSQVLKNELMERTSLVTVLNEVGKEATKQPPEKHRKGFMGHITRIANILLSASTTSPYMKQVLECEGWMQFAGGYLIPQNRVETSKYLEPERKESEENPAESAQDDVAFLLAADKDENEEENEDAFEFKVDHPFLTPDELDKSNLFNFGGDAEVSSDPEVETSQGSDIYNNLNFWKLPINSEELDELE